MLKARVEVGLKSELDNDRVMMAVDVRIDSVKPLENLTDEYRKCLWKVYA